MIGQTITHFHVLEKLGGGGMGVVYLAEDARLKRRVALKFLPPHLSTDEEANLRFAQEARSASALNHANICAIYDIGETDDGQMFIAMAHYEGQTLKEKLERGALPTDEALDIARQVAEGLAAAHDKGIVHRDVKPANIFVTDRRRAVILDFGLAKLTGALELTKSGSTLGTAYYMSPEQIRSEPVDHRTDIWSLGVMLFEMLSGKRPFSGDYEQAVTYAILNEKPPPLEGQSPAIEDIVAQSLQKNPRDRTARASDLAERLKSAAGTASTTLHTNGHQGRTLGTRPILIGIAGIVAVILAAVLLWPRGETSVGQNDSPVASKPALVVLSFRNAGPPEFDYMAFGVANDIATRLMSVEQLEIRATRSAANMVEEGKSIQEIAATLNVDYVLDGTYQVSGARVRMSPQLIRVSDEAQVWADQYDGDFDDALGFQARVATSVAENLGIVLDLGERQQLGEKLTTNNEAYLAYLRGMASIPQVFGGEDSAREALEFFEEACRLDPNFVRAHVQRARLYGWLVFLQILEPSDTRALEAADAVERLRPSSVDSRIAAGYVDYYIKRDFQSALTHFQAAMELSPSDPDVSLALGFIRRRLGLFEEAIAAFKSAYRLNPTMSHAALSIAETEMGLGRFAESDLWFERAIKTNPLAGFHLELALVSGWQGDTARARSLLESGDQSVHPGQLSAYWSRAVHLPERDFTSILARTDTAATRLLSDRWQVEALWARGIALHYSSGDTESVRSVWRALLRRAPDANTIERNLWIPFAYAGLGERALMISSIDNLKAMVENDNHAIPIVLFHSAAALSLSGDHDGALNELEELSRRPYRQYHSHPAALQLVYFDPLRDDHRFQELVENWE